MRDLFPELDPPPGGLNRLRTRLERNRRRRWMAAAVLALVLAFLLFPRSEAIDDPNLAAFGLYQPTAPVEALPGSRTATERVDVSDANTVFYRVASLD